MTKEDNNGKNLEGKLTKEDKAPDIMFCLALLVIVGTIAVQLYEAENKDRIFGIITLTVLAVCVRCACLFARSIDRANPRGDEDQTVDHEDRSHSPRFGT